MSKKTSLNSGSPDDIAFDDLLRSVKVKVPLHGTFQSEVWQRISATQESSFAARAVCWFDSVLGALVRPQTAGAAMLAMILAGLWFGSLGGEPVRDGKLAYVESVSPFAHEHQRGSQ